MGHDIFVAFWFFLPAGLANVAPIFAAHLPGLRRWNVPLDMGRSWRGKRILGDHKTWRGLIVGAIVATATLWLQRRGFAASAALRRLVAPLDYAALPLFVLGPLFALGALGGDALKSFFKRRRGTPPGHAWFPFDQIDYIAGSALLTAPVVRLRATQYVWAFGLWIFVHLVSSGAGYVVGLKDSPI